MSFVTRQFTVNELRDLLDAWERANPAPKSPPLFGTPYWAMHTYLAEAITEGNRMDREER